jgi:hypothetical protein
VVSIPARDGDRPLAHTGQSKPEIGTYGFFLLKFGVIEFFRYDGSARDV